MFVANGADGADGTDAMIARWEPACLTLGGRCATTRLLSVVQISYIVQQ